MHKQLETRIGVFVLAAIALFFFLSFQIGSFRFNRSQYNSYLVYFKDISGISPKSQVKIAGVEVGWVETISLISDDEHKAQADITVRKEYTLTTDAYAIIRQDGMLGPYYLEILPGNPLLPALEPGSPLLKASKETIPIDRVLEKCTTLADTIEDVSNHLDTTLLPLFQQSIERITSVFDRDIGSVAERLGKTAHLLDQASLEAHYGLKTACGIADKVDKGEGFIGKLVHDNESYDDLKYAIQGIRNYIAKMDHIHIIWDSHAEYLFRSIENNASYGNSKVYFDFCIQPSEHYFFLLQLISTEHSIVDTLQNSRAYGGIDTRSTDSNTVLDSNTRTRSKQYDFNMGAQVAKRFDNLVFRLGLFEGLSGIAVDYMVPLPTDNLKWITTFEAFDLRGLNRNNDHHLHLKWLNRVFACNNMYLTFGADDVMNRSDTHLFFGLGLRFGDTSTDFSLAGLRDIISSSGTTNEKMVEGMIVS